VAFPSLPWAYGESQYAREPGRPEAGKMPSRCLCHGPTAWASTRVSHYAR